MLSSFFGSSCVPGAMDPTRAVGEIKVNLCSLCPDVGSGASSAVHPSTSTKLGPNFIPLGITWKTQINLKMENEKNYFNH